MPSRLVNCHHHPGALASTFHLRSSLYCVNLLHFAHPMPSENSTCAVCNKGKEEAETKQLFRCTKCKTTLYCGESGSIKAVTYNPDAYSPQGKHARDPTGRHTKMSVKLPKFGTTSIAGAEMVVNTKAILSSSLGIALRKILDGEIAARTSRTNCVASSRRSSAVIWRSSTNIGRKGCVGHAAG
jgi:hypothetical protein